MKKKIGLITLWANSFWVELALKQALTIVDELHVSVIPFSKALLKFEDDTLDKVKKFKKKEKNIFIYTLDDFKFGLLNKNIFQSKYFMNNGYHATTKCIVLNEMISNSKYFKKGNWIWILDSDEFYNNDLIYEINKIIEEDTFNTIEVRSKFYFLNMLNYIISSHLRLFKIETINTLPLNKLRFRPSQKWRVIKQKKILTSQKNLMNHYSFLTSIKMREESWKNEFYNNPQKLKIDWLTQIYSKIQLDNVEASIKTMKFLFNENNIFFKDNFIFNNGGFFIDGEKHPDIIEKTDLKIIKDFRSIY